MNSESYQEDLAARSMIQLVRPVKLREVFETRADIRV